MSFSWVDILIGAILLFAILKGIKRGFVMELAGAIALILSLITPWLYNGSFDEAIARTVHLPSGVAHIIAMVLVGIATYIAVMLAARIVNAIAKLPVLGTGNALAGGAVGFAKGAIGIWIVLYIALFFTLTPQIRSDLRHSAGVAFITQFNARVDGAIIGTLPSFARPVLQPVFDRHQV